jgi:hypothetical protein
MPKSPKPTYNADRAVRRVHRRGCEPDRLRPGRAHGRRGQRPPREHAFSTRVRSRASSSWSAPARTARPSSTPWPTRTPISANPPATDADPTPTEEEPKWLTSSSTATAGRVRPDHRQHRRSHHVRAQRRHPAPVTLVPTGLEGFESTQERSTTSRSPRRSTRTSSRAAVLLGHGPGAQEAGRHRHRVQPAHDPNTNGYIVIRDGIDQATAWATSDKVEVYPVTTAAHFDAAAAARRTPCSATACRRPSPRSRTSRPSSPDPRGGPHRAGHLTLPAHGARGFSASRRRHTMNTYLYRCTEQQLEEHLRRIAESGDVVEHVIFKGGRDYVLVCRKASEPVAVRIVSTLGPSLLRSDASRWRCRVSVLDTLRAPPVARARSPSVSTARSRPSTTELRRARPGRRAGREGSRSLPRRPRPERRAKPSRRWKTCAPACRPRS